MTGTGRCEISEKSEKTQRVLVQKDDVMPRRPYPRWRRRHQAILQAVVENPCTKRKEIARTTDYSPWQVSRIINSPDFQERYERMRKIIERELTRQYVERL